MAASLDISSQVDRSEITIGDRIHYEIKVVFPKEGSLELPSVLGNLGAFEVKDYQAPDPKDAGNLKIQTWRFDLSTFTVGKYTLPPQQILYREGKDTAATAYFTQPIEINVKRTSAETVKDIADIAPLAPMAAGTPWLLYGLGGAAVLIVALIVWRFLRKKAPPRATVKPALPPFEEALAALAGIKDGALIRQNRAREYCFILSEALRRYLSRRYGIDALESTTAEFLDKARALPVTSAQKEWLAKFCEQTDLVKFANALLLESDASAMLARTEDFFRQTKPKEGEPAEAPRPGSEPSETNGAGSNGLTGKPTAGSGAAKPQAPGGGPAKNASAATGPSKPVGPAKGPVKPKGPTGPGYIQGGHGHDNPDRGWSA